MANYHLEARTSARQHQEAPLDPATMDAMWRLFVEIGRFWRNVDRPERMKSNFVVFLGNRIQLNPGYVDEYRNAAAVIAELVADYGDPAGYRKLFTDPQANLAPPTTRMARARQLVSNEFVALQLALGGFKAFGGAKNYLGFIAGANLPGHTPYRKYQPRKGRSPHAR